MDSDCFHLIETVLASLAHWIWIYTTQEEVSSTLYSFLIPSKSNISKAAMCLDIAALLSFL
jgi:hypothetical protein